MNTTTGLLKFSATRAEEDVISQIADRAAAMLDKFDVEYTYTTLLMDIEVCHSNGMPLDLIGLQAAPDGDFAHDIGGIRRHINRETGAIEDCFVPRYAADYNTVNVDNLG